MSGKGHDDWSNNCGDGDDLFNGKMMHIWEVEGCHCPTPNKDGNLKFQILGAIMCRF